MPVYKVYALLVLGHAENETGRLTFAVQVECQADWLDKADGYVSDLEFCLLSTVLVPPWMGMRC